MIRAVVMYEIRCDCCGLAAEDEWNAPQWVTPAQAAKALPEWFETFGDEHACGKKVCRDYVARSNGAQP